MLTMTVYGVPSAKAYLGKKNAQAIILIDNGLNDGMKDVEKDSKLMCPVDTGTLQASIHFERPSVVSAVIMDGTDYGIYQEKGTSIMTPQPFLEPSVELNLPNISQKIKANLRLL